MNLSLKMIITWLSKRDIKIAKELGMLKRVDIEHPIRFLDFCKLETVDYYSKQLRGCKLKNLKTEKSWLKTTRG